MSTCSLFYPFPASCCLTVIAYDLLLNLNICWKIPAQFFSIWTTTTGTLLKSDCEPNTFSSVFFFVYLKNIIVSPLHYLFTPFLCSSWLPSYLTEILDLYHHNPSQCNDLVHCARRSSVWRVKAWLNLHNLVGLIINRDDR